MSYITFRNIFIAFKSARKIETEQSNKWIPSRRKNHQLTFNMRRSIPQKSDTKIVMTVVRGYSVNPNVLSKEEILNDEVRRSEIFWKPFPNIPDYRQFKYMQSVSLERIFGHIFVLLDIKALISKRILKK